MVAGARSTIVTATDRYANLIRTGQILLAEKGFAGREFKQLTTARGLRLLRPDRQDCRLMISDMRRLETTSRNQA
jgi:hypothetical protein